MELIRTPSMRTHNLYFVKEQVNTTNYTIIATKAYFSMKNRHFVKWVACFILTIVLTGSPKIIIITILKSLVSRYNNASNNADELAMNTIDPDHSTRSRAV